MADELFENESLDETAKWTTRRRSVLKGAAWAVPALVAVSATPAAAASVRYSVVFAPSPVTITATAANENDQAAWNATTVNGPITLTLYADSTPLPATTASIQIQGIGGGNNPLVKFAGPSATVISRTSNSSGVIVLDSAEIVGSTLPAGAATLTRMIVTVFPHGYILGLVPVEVQGP